MIRRWWWRRHRSARLLAALRAAVDLDAIPVVIAVHGDGSATTVTVQDLSVDRARMADALVGLAFAQAREGDTARSRTEAAAGSAGEPQRR